MAFSKELKNEIELYCFNHLATDSWYENEFCFIQDIELRNRIIAEFKAKEYRRFRNNRIKNAVYPG